MQGKIVSSAAPDLRKVGQLTAFANQMAKNGELFEDGVNHHSGNSIDLDVNMSSQMQSPEYSNDVNSKAARKRQIDAMNIKKT